MTISTEAVPLTYNGDDVTVAFPITWEYFAKSHVLVTHRDSAGVETTWVLDTDYTLTAAGVDAGGTLTATTAPATNETLRIELDPPNTQTADLPFGGSFPSPAVEDALDLAAQRSSKLEAFFNRSLRVPKTDTQSDDLDLPIDSERASKWLQFDSNGAVVVVEPTDLSGTAVTATGTATSRTLAERFSQVARPEDEGALGDSSTLDTTAIQAVLTRLGANGGGVLLYDGSKSYKQGSVNVPHNCIIEGNGATIIPDSTPAQCFLVATDFTGGTQKDDIVIRNLKQNGNVTDFIKITGSGWNKFQAENITSLGGTGNSLIKTEIESDKNPSGFRLKNVTAFHAGFKYGWHGTGEATSDVIDHVDVDVIEMWPDTAGYAVYVEHKVGGNSDIDKLYVGAGSMAGGGCLYIRQMEGGRIGYLWGEPNSAISNVSMMVGSYQNVEVGVIHMQVDTSQSSNTRLINAHMFNCSIAIPWLQDDAGTGYEQDDAPPANEKVFRFTEDAQGTPHITRDVRIGNIKGNFNLAHIDDADSSMQNVRYFGQPGDDLVYADHTTTTYTGATTGIGNPSNADSMFCEFSNWLWGYADEALEIIVSGTIVGVNAKDIRIQLEETNTILGRMDAAAAGAFIVRAIVIAHNDGANRLRVMGSAMFNDALKLESNNSGNTWARDDTRTSKLYVYAPTFNAADSINIESVVIRHLKATTQ